MPSPRLLLLALAAVLAAPAPADAASRAAGPRLTAPAAAVVKSSRVAFHWTARAGARRYELRLSRNARFRGVESYRVRPPRATVLLARGTWFAKVRSWTPGGVWSAWGAPRRFRVVPAKDLLPPSRPAALRVTAVTDTTVRLAFGASRDEFGVVGYEVLANGRRVARLAARARIVEGLACSTRYVLKVRALDRAGHRSQASPTARVQTRACADAAPPVAPATLEATSVTDAAVALHWADGSDPDGNFAGYVLTRDGVELGRPKGTSYTAASLEPQRTYTFAVRSRDRAGNLSPETTLTVTTPAPVQSTGLVHAFLLASDGESFRDFQAHYTGIDAVFPTYYDVRADGTLEGADQPHVTRFAQQRGVRVLPRVQTQTPATIAAVVGDPAIRARLVSEIAATAQAQGFDGITIDFEAGAATLRPQFAQFIAQLATALHADGRTLTVCASVTTSYTTVGRAGFYDYAALSAAADEVFLLAWNEHWATSPAGSLASIGWVGRIMAYVDTFHRNAKFTFGTHMYGYDWPTGQRGTPVEWTGIGALKASVGAVDGYDAAAHEPTFTYSSGGVPHTVYYANAASISERLAAYRARGYGMGVWRLGREDPSFWSQPVVWP